MPQPVPDQRYIVAISDLHFGAGKVDGAWSPKEDFKWHKALAGFLDKVSACAGDKVDLVIAGDMLELWQTHDNKKCAKTSGDAGCTVDELTVRVKTVVAQHGQDLALFGQFADRGENRVFVVPGNHDSALLFAAPWQELSAAMKSAQGRVSRVDSGLWRSADGQVLVEHGHQIGSDLNKYPRWPNVSMSDASGASFVERPWGEQFVQEIFNQQEDVYPVIDNLSPESAGAKIRMADRGAWKSVKDMARFVRFNLLETSLSQKGSVLSKQDDNSSDWVDVKLARGKGHKLFVAAMDSQDPFRAELIADAVSSAELRRELDGLAETMPDDEIKALCVSSKLRGASASLCTAGTLGTLTEKLLHSRDDVLRTHLKARMKEAGNANMRIFVYGHTHLLEPLRELKLSDSKSIGVLNTGAFQRVIDEQNFLRIAKKMGYATPSQALKGLRVENLQPCYSAVLIATGPQRTEARTVYWKADENEPGVVIATKDAKCQVAP
jgi:UDP-2,3-diacylglucosamine pyrophosphatase LpxH